MGRTLWLIGMMGAGKTAVAPLVGEALDMPSVDADRVVEEQSNRTVPDLFAESEKLFRDFESAALAGIAGEPVVVACGGGVVLRAANVETMRGSGTVVWLRAGVDTLAARVGRGEDRPLVGVEPVEAIERLSSERAGLYGAAADAIVDTDGRTVRDVAAEVVRVWNESSGE